MRKVRKMIKAVKILEEQFVNVNETIASLVTDTATNNASIASNDVKLATLTGNVTSNTVDIASNMDKIQHVKVFHPTYSASYLLSMYDKVNVIITQILSCIVIINE